MQPLTTERFIDLYGTRTGRWLANRLGLSGKGSQHLANLLSAYAWNNRAAQAYAGVCAMKAAPMPKCVYTSYCVMLRQDIEAHPLYSLCLRTGLSNGPCSLSRKLAFW